LETTFKKSSLGQTGDDMSIKGHFTTRDPLNPNNSYSKADFSSDPNFTFPFTKNQV
jgi:hypothetical protein